MQHTTPLAAAATALLLLAACSSGGAFTVPTTTAAADSTIVSTTAPEIAGRYVDQVFQDVGSRSDVVYATAADLQSGNDVDLHVDVYEPNGDTLAQRPVILWVHGGGFMVGSKESLREIATAWAERGYVSVTVEYRLDRTARCQEVQDSKFTGSELAAQQERCSNAILAAQHDTQAAVRWVRANAEQLRVDPDRIAAAGFSAGAITAVNVATEAEHPGDVGDHLDESSDIAVALAASGCSYTPADIDAHDAPLFLVASERDQAVPFECTRATERAATAAGLDVETSYHMGEGTHAKSLYEKYQREIDPAWAAFLVVHLDL